MASLGHPLASAVTESDRLLEAATGESLRSRIREVAGLDVRFGSMSAQNVPPRKTRLRFILNALENLLETVDSADAAPGPDANVRFAQLKLDAERAFGDWRVVKAK